MKKFKIIFGVFGVTVCIMAILWLVMPRMVGSDSPGENFPKKDADILPTLPIPKTLPLPKGATTQIVFVPRVIDGDTIVVEPVDAATGQPGKQETIRYIGMDTPETVSPVKPVECYGHEASVRNKTLVDGKYVAIVPDATDKDKYGRLLRFVYLLNTASGTPALGTLVDLELVREGYARALTIPPNTEFEAEFKAASAAAQSAKLGFWGACATYPFQ